MKVTLIRPSMMPGRAFDAMEPLSFAVLAGCTPPGVELALYDERVEEIPTDDATDLVALTVETYTARRAYEIAEAYRGRGIPVVMGGFHPTCQPEECGRFADAVVTGDGESAWPHVVRDAEAGKLQPLYEGGSPPMGGVVPDRSLFKGKGYGALRPVQFGRGCRFSCEFCSIHAFFGSQIRHRPLQEVVGELEALETRNVLFVDDNLFADVEQARRLLDAIRPMGLRWVAQVSLDVASDPRLLDEMAAAGCATALIGFESLDPSNLRQMGKRWMLRHGDAAAAIRRFRERGIMVYGSFVFGYDHDTPESFDATVEFAIDSRMCLANFNPLTPMPGTRLHERLRAEGRLLFDRWWIDPRFRYGAATFRPMAMTADELTEGCLRARLRFNTLTSCLARATDLRANARRLPLFLAANWISRKEILRKQGAHLGTGVPLSGMPLPA